MDDKIKNSEILSEDTLEQVAGGTASNQKLIEYPVVKGDTLGRLAKKYKTTIEAIMALNPIIKNRNLIRIGWVLLIPDNR